MSEKVKWRNLKEFNLPSNYICFWRYEFTDGDVRHFCHEYSMVKHDKETKRLGEIKSIHFINPQDIKI